MSFSLLRIHQVTSLFALAFAFALLGLPLGNVAVAQKAGEERAVAHEILVRFKAQTSSTRRNAFLATRSAKVLHYFHAVDIHHLRLPDKANVNEAVAEFLRNPEVASAQPNYIRHTTAAAPPNDPYWLNNTLWGLQKVQMPSVWQHYNTGDSTVIVADVDTGVDYTHPDLTANMWHNPGEIPGNGVDDDGDGYTDDVYGIDAVNHDSDPMDDYGHGTHTAGTMAAVGNNGVGITGVGWNFKIIACKFLDASGSGTDAGAIECFNYLILLKQRGVNIRAVNESWGGSRGSDPFPQALKDGIDAVGAAGMLNICAAGNSSVNLEAAPFDPASFDSPSVISVAASDQLDHRAGFSNYGGISVDLAAPGVEIVSTYLGSYAGISGTSMATPHVAGAVSILAALNPTLSGSAIKALLLNNVDVIPEWNGLVVSGGRLNVLRAAAAVDQVPNVAISNLVNGASYATPATLTLSANANDPDGSVTSVSFYANDLLLGTKTSSPYSVQWSNIPPGNYVVTAIATDNLGARGTSDPLAVTISDTAPTDSDADGIADSWELQYFGSLAVATATTDYDGDGISDLFEYLSGTDPTSAGSHLRATVAARDQGGFHVAVTTSPTYSYQLERSDDLSSWQAIGNFTPGDGTILTLTDSSQASAGPSFYHVIVSHSSP